MNIWLIRKDTFFHSNPLIFRRKIEFNLQKIAAALAFIIGAMAVFAGGQVLLGKVMDYYVIDWLPIYNFIAGLVSSLITAILIWKGSKFALPAAIGTFCCSRGCDAGFTNCL